MSASVGTTLVLSLFKELWSLLTVKLINFVCFLFYNHGYIWWASSGTIPYWFKKKGWPQFCPSACLKYGNFFSQYASYSPTFSQLYSDMHKLNKAAHTYNPA